MSITCPRCGKNNTSLFSDSVLKSTGFFCEDCKKDFGVNTEGELQLKEENLLEFYYKRVTSDGITYRIHIQDYDGKVLMTPSIVKDKMLTPFESVDFSDMWEQFKSLLFEKIFLLDWNPSLTGFGDGVDSYEVELKYKDKKYPDVLFTGTNLFPPYLIVLDQMFMEIFESKE